jgi:hypothetical protein
MNIAEPIRQLESAAMRAGLIAMFGPLAFDQGDAEVLGSLAEGDEAEVGFMNEGGRIRKLLVDLRDSGDPEDGGLSVGLRGWWLHEDVASV